MLFPDLPPDDFAAFVQDIRQNGVKVPILVHRGKILDGRQRYRACQKLNKPCPTVRWDGQDPWLEVQSRNLMRRHLAKDQVYAICKLAAERFPEIATPIQAAKTEAKRRQGRKTPAQGLRGGDSAHLRSQDRNKESADLIGAQFGVSGTTVKRVERLAREAPEFIPKVAAGELSVKKALLQVALQKRNSATTAPGKADSFQIEQYVRRLQSTIKDRWSKCPIEHRPPFLYGLQRVLRELITEQTASGASRSADGRTLDRQQPKAS